MVSFGIVYNIRGPVLPLLRDQYRVNHAHIGLLLAACSVAYHVSTLLSGWLHDRLGARLVMLSGYLLTALGILMFPFTGSFPTVLLAYLVIHLGFGFFEVGVNSLCMTAAGNRPAVTMNVIHMFYGLGSIVAPPVTVWLIAQQHPWYTAYLAAMLTLVVGAYLVYRTPAENGEPDEHARGIIFGLLKHRVIWLYTALTGLCLVVELGTANWLVLYLQTDRAFPAPSAAQALSLFFILFSISRLVSGYLIERIGYVRSITWALFVCAVFGVAGAMSASLAWALSAVGFFAGILFPTLMVLLKQAFPDTYGNAMGVVITLSSVLSMVANAAVGWLGDHVGLSLALLVFPFSALCGIGICRLLKGASPVRSADSV